jgi:hypothetical protein
MAARGVENDHDTIYVTVLDRKTTVKDFEIKQLLKTKIKTTNAQHRSRRQPGRSSAKPRQEPRCAGGIDPLAVIEECQQYNPNVNNIKHEFNHKNHLILFCLCFHLSTCTGKITIRQNS